MQPFSEKKGLNFSQPDVQQERFQNSKELMQRELDVNRAEQVLLERRIQLMNSFINDLPSSDPQYSTLLVQARMDQIEIDELKVREMFIVLKISEYT